MIRGKCDSLEVWKDIDRYEGRYQVSNMGRIRSMNYRRKHFAQVIKQGTDAYGYPKIRLSANGKRTEYKVHRLVAIAFIENPYDLSDVNHKDGNKKNNTVSNFEWVTKIDNSKHQHDTGLVSIGARKKPVVATRIGSGELIYFKSIAEAGRNLGIDCAHISYCLSGKCKTGKGYTFNLSHKKGSVIPMYKRWS